MTDRVLDIWAIQNNPTELFLALKNITTNDVIFFKNLLCKFKIGNKVIPAPQFDAMVYSENSDTLILFMRGGEAKIETAEKYLEQHNILYHTVQFLERPTKKKQKLSDKEFWFARDSYVVEDAIADSISKGNNSCKYNPQIRSAVLLNYPIKENDNEIMIRLSFRGLIEFPDKYILPTVSKWQKNLHESDIMAILEEKNVKIEVDNNLNCQSIQ